MKLRGYSMVSAAVECTRPEARANRTIRRPCPTGDVGPIQRSAALDQRGVQPSGEPIAKPVGAQFPPFLLLNHGLGQMPVRRKPRVGIGGLDAQPRIPDCRNVRAGAAQVRNARGPLRHLEQGRARQQFAAVRFDCMESDEGYDGVRISVRPFAPPSRSDAPSRPELRASSRVPPSMRRKDDGVGASVFAANSMLPINGEWQPGQ